MAFSSSKQPPLATIPPGMRSWPIVSLNKSRVDDPLAESSARQVSHNSANNCRNEKDMMDGYPLDGSDEKNNANLWTLNLK